MLPDDAGDRQLLSLLLRVMMTFDEQSQGPGAFYTAAIERGWAFADECRTLVSG